jgi:hypothetical protein
MMAALRDHGRGAEGDWSPAKGLRGFTVCAHAGFGPIRATQTTGSMVSHLRPAAQTHFLTGTAAPCTSLFKPVWTAGGGIPVEPLPEGNYDAATRFWRHEALHRAVLREYPRLSGLGRRERLDLQRGFVEKALACPPGERDELTARCFAEAEAFEARLGEEVRASAPRRYPGFLYAKAWQGFDLKAGMPKIR